MQSIRCVLCRGGESGIEGKISGKWYVKWAEAVCAAILLTGALLTFHDMQTAEGTGLYLAIRAGADNRLPYDLLVDGAGMLGLCVLLLMPCILIKRLRLDSFLRFACACFAFLPVISTALPVHLADGTEVLSFPILTEFCTYIMIYLVLLCGFSLWEKLYDAYPALHDWGWILFGFFGLRGIERMLVVMSVCHI